MRANLLKSSLSGILQLVVSTVIVFITIPLFIDSLGTQLYGIFSLLLLIGNLNVFVNLGFNTSLVKFLAEQGRTLESNYDIIVSIFLILIILLPVFLFGLIFREFILLEILNISEDVLTKSIVDCYLFLLAANVFLLLGQISTAILDSQQKIYLTNFFQILYNIMYWGFILISLVITPALDNVGLSILIATIIWYFLVTISALKNWNFFNLSQLNKNFIRISKKQLSYSSKIYLSGTINFFYEPLTKIFISNFIGVNEVGIFDIGIRVRNQLWFLVSKIIYPIYPILSNIKDYKYERLFVHDVEQKTAFFLLPLIVTVVFGMHSFVELWIGNNVYLITITIIVLIIGNTLSMLVLPNYLYLIAKGYAGKTVIMQSLNVIVNVAIFFLFYSYLNYYAVLLGNLLAICSSFLLCLYYQHKIFQSLIFENKNQFIKFMVILSISVIAAAIIVILPVQNIVEILILIFTIPLISVVMFRKLSIFNIMDIERYIKGNSVLKKITKKILLK